MPKAITGCWRILKDAEGCWRMLKVHSGFMFSGPSQIIDRSLTDHWQIIDRSLIFKPSLWIRITVETQSSVGTLHTFAVWRLLSNDNHSDKSCQHLSTWTTSHVIILELIHVEPCVAAWCFSAAFCIWGEHLEMLHAAVERFSFLRDAIRLLSLWSTLVGWVFGGMASRKNALIAGTFSQGLHRHSVHYTFATGQPATVTLLFCVCKEEVGVILFCVCKEEVGVILWIHFCFSRSRDLHTAEWQLGSQLKRVRQNEITLSLSLYLSRSPRLSAPWMLCMQHLSMTVAPYSFA